MDKTYVASSWPAELVKRRNVDGKTKSAKPRVRCSAPAAPFVICFAIEPANLRACFQFKYVVELREHGVDKVCAPAVCSHNLPLQSHIVPPDALARRVGPGRLSPAATLSSCIGLAISLGDLPAARCRQTASCTLRAPHVVIVFSFVHNLQMAT